MFPEEKSIKIPRAESTSIPLLHGESKLASSKNEIIASDWIYRLCCTLVRCLVDQETTVQYVCTHIKNIGMQGSIVEHHNICTVSVMFFNKYL